MRQIIAVQAAEEDKFLATHLHWTMERRVQDEEGIVFLSFRLDVAAEKKEMRPLLVATRAIARDQQIRRLAKPLYAGPQEALSERRTYRYRPLPFERQPVTVIAPPLMEVPGARKRRYTRESVSEVERFADHSSGIVSTLISPGWCGELTSECTGLPPYRRAEMVVRFEHANLCVRDMEAMIRFLQTAFPEFRVLGEGMSNAGRR